MHFLQRKKRVRAALAGELALAGSGDLSGQFRAAGAGPAGGKGGAFTVDGEVQVDAVQQWPGELGAVALDLFRRTAATAAGVAEIAAGAGVHRCHQLEACREAHTAAGAGDDNFAPFQRFAENLQDLAIELRQLPIRDVSLSACQPRP